MFANDGRDSPDAKSKAVRCACSIHTGSNVAAPLSGPPNALLRMWMGPSGPWLRSRQVSEQRQGALADEEQGGGAGRKGFGIEQRRRQEKGGSWPRADDARLPPCCLARSRGRMDRLAGRGCRDVPRANQVRYPRGRAGRRLGQRANDRAQTITGCAAQECHQQAQECWRPRPRLLAEHSPALCSSAHAVNAHRRRHREGYAMHAPRRAAEAHRCEPPPLREWEAGTTPQPTAAPSAPPTAGHLPPRRALFACLCLPAAYLPAHARRLSSLLRVKTSTERSTPTRAWLHDNPLSPGQSSVKVSPRSGRRPLTRHYSGRASALQPRASRPFSTAT